MRDTTMPRSTISCTALISKSFKTKKSKKIFNSPTKFNDQKKKSINSLKSQSEKRKKNIGKPIKVLKFSSQDVFSFSLAHVDDRLLPSTFGFTQRRKYSSFGGHQYWDDSGARVAIIGAGIAGLSAADHLISNGVTNINIFEATSRLGGRVNTARFDDGQTCELGAEWLAGGDSSNGLVVLASQEGLIANADWRYNRQIICLLSEGKPLSSDMCYLGRKIFNKVRAKAFKLYNSGSDTKHGTLAYFINKRFDEEKESYSENWSSCLERLKHALVNDLRVRFGVDLSLMSSDMVGFSSSEPGDAMKLKGGLVNALLPLVREIPKEKIHLDTPVKTVFWEQNITTLILGDNTKIPADYIIVTVPLGFLKKNHTSFFHPNLPPDKIEAIEKVGVGNVTKIFLKYPMKLWGKRRTEISTLWKTRDWIDRDIFWNRGISCISVQDDIATIAVGGPEAVFIENEPAEGIARDITAMLRCFTNSSILPMPSEIIKSSYNSDVWYNGSGSYMSYDTTPCHLYKLAEPLAIPDSLESPKIFFAGEVTYTQDINTVHGARLSGVREAQRIIDLVMPVSQKNHKFKRQKSSIHS